MVGAPGSKTPEFDHSPMHDNSYQLCKNFALGLLTHRPGPLTIADVGSFDINGTYRPLFDRTGWRYVGFDIQSGPNVDVVLRSLDGWELDPSHVGGFDVVVSGQCVEHVAAPWRWIKDVARLLRPGGLLWISAPNTEVFHEHPIDAWRIWPDGMRALLAEADFEVISCETFGADTSAIAKKSY